MNKTKIECFDYTWNPVTGCLHDCPYCYARKQARRFHGYELEGETTCFNPYDGPVELEKPLSKITRDGKVVAAPYPYGFDPTFHRYRLNEPQSVKEPKNIFVCSMADLFGDWVPDEWIDAVFVACEAAPWHRYLFLTKNPARYTELAEKKILPEADNLWYGSTVTTQEERLWWSDRNNTFVSIEPIMRPFDKINNPIKTVDWVIIDAETGNRKGKVRPERAWIENILETASGSGIPVFMKNSLADVWGEPLIQEFPWGEANNAEEI